MVQRGKKKTTQKEEVRAGSSLSREPVPSKEYPTIGGRRGNPGCGVGTKIEKGKPGGGCTTGGRGSLGKRKQGVSSTIQMLVKKGGEADRVLCWGRKGGCVKGRGEGLRPALCKGGARLRGFERKDRSRNDLPGENIASLIREKAWQGDQRHGRQSGKSGKKRRDRAPKKSENVQAAKRVLGKKDQGGTK